MFNNAVINTYSARIDISNWLVIKNHKNSINTILLDLVYIPPPPPPNRNSVVFRKVEVPYCTLKIGTSNITIFTQYCLITHLQRTMPTTISSVENVRNGNTTENVRSIMLNAVLVALANSCNQCFEASFT